MRDHFQSRDGSLVVAWALALVFAALVAVPMLWNDHPTRTPGIIDIGIPGVSVEGAAGRDDAADPYVVEFTDGDVHPAADGSVAAERRDPQLPAM